MYYEHGQSPFGFQLMARNTRTRHTLADMYDSTGLIHGTDDFDNSATFFQAAVPALTVRYSGAGAGTIQKTGGNGAGALVLTDAAGTLSIPLGAIDNLVEYSAVASQIGARAGWTATVNNNAFAARFACYPNYPNASPVLDAKTTAQTFISFCDVHADWMQGFGGITNQIIWFGRLLTPSISQALRNDGVQKDISVRNCVLAPGFAGSIDIGGASQQHWVFSENSTTCPLNVRAGDATYTEVESNVAYTLANPDGGASVPANNNASVIAASGSITGSGNFTTGSFANAFADIGAGDASPAGVVLSTLAPQRSSWDINGTARSANDCAGAVSKNPAA
jgi:hypothetical protein